MAHTFRVLLTTAAALTLVGCDGARDGIPREPISGKVTLDGASLEDGQITFTPAAGGEPIAAAAIKEGRYTLRRADGPSPGPHRVNIWSRKPTGKRLPSDVEPGTFIEETGEIIPARYNLKSELKADVEKGGDNRFDFDLKSETVAPNARR
jgi:hypothetical protein